VFPNTLFIVRAFNICPRCVRRGFPNCTHGIDSTGIICWYTVGHWSTFV